jgi:ABC-type lipoprotein release transport system permease subunit
LALGAAPVAVVGLFLRQGLVLAGIGLAAGLAGALALTRVLRRMLVGVTPEDPLTFLFVTVAMVAVAVSACYLPARRALKVDPSATLRAEGA